MCQSVIDWDKDYDDVIWHQAFHPSIPGMFLIACCPDCEKPMIFTENDGKQYVYIMIEGSYFKLWITSELPNNILQNFIQ